MTPIAGIARQFFEACEAGQGWDACKAYCHPNATFSAQAEPLADVKTLQQYTEWMIRRREDQAHDENLARRMGDETGRLGLIKTRCL